MLNFLFLKSNGHKGTAQSTESQPVTGWERIPRPEARDDNLALSIVATSLPMAPSQSPKGRTMGIF